MLHSTQRKLVLSGWLQNHDNFAYSAALRLQKFLFFYEAFTKAAGEQADFLKLRGYERGPVFSSVWGDYTKERPLFNKMCHDLYLQNEDKINRNRASRSAFIVSSLSERELSSLTHQFNIWACKENRIMRGEYQVDLSEMDFDGHDSALVAQLEEIYPDRLIQNSQVFPLDEFFFIFDKKDAKRLKAEDFDTLSALSRQADLHNPVFVEIDDKGCLCVD